MFPASDIFKTGHNTVNDQLLNPLALANGSTEIHALVSRVYISVLWAIDTCQNKVFADLYHVILSQVKVNLEFIEVLEITSSPNTSFVSISFIRHNGHKKS